MTSGPISSWQIDGEKLKQWETLFLGAPKITADGDCSHEIKTLSPWKSYDKPAKSLQLCPTLCDPIDGSPPGSAVPGILQARTLEWVAISFSNAWKWKVKVKTLSCVGLLATPWTAAYQAPLSTGFSRQEYWCGLPLPSPMTSLDSILKSRDITLLTKVHLVKAMVFLVVMYVCENWTIRKAEHWRIDALNVLLQKAIESPLDCKQMKSVNPKGNKPWIFIWGTDVKDDAPILWPPDAKRQLIRKDPDAGKDWRQEEKGMTED